MEMVGEDLRLHFDHGYIALTEDFPQVEGNILLQKADLDFSCVHLLSDHGAYGDFRGKKLEIPEFLKDYSPFSLEITDEYYGYNTVVYGGYLSLPDREELIELSISLYYTGNIIYEVKD